MALEDDNKKPTQPFPVLCGLAVGSMPAMLQLPVIGKIIFWLLGNPFFMIFYLFAIYLPWMIGNIFARFLKMPILVPTLLCMFYWVVLGGLIGTPKYSKKAWFYVLIAHVFIPLVYLLNLIGFGRVSDFSFQSFFNTAEIFARMLGQ